MVKEAAETWEGTERFELSVETEGLFVPPGFPSMRGHWRTYLEKESIQLWRFWWEHWLTPECCRCCCDHHPSQVSSTVQAASTLAIDLHLVRLFVILHPSGNTPYEIHLGWMITGASGQVTALLEYRSATGPYRQVQSFQGTSIADYTVQPPGGRWLYGPQTVWFRLTATDRAGKAVQELPVNLP